MRCWVRMPSQNGDTDPLSTTNWDWKENNGVHFNQNKKSLQSESKLWVHGCWYVGEGWVVLVTTVSDAMQERHLANNTNMDLDNVLLLFCFLRSKTISLYAAVQWKPFLIVFSRLIHWELRVELFDFDILPQQTEFQQLDFEKQSEWSLKDISVLITLYATAIIESLNFFFTVPSPNQSNSVQSDLNTQIRILVLG